ncbi:MAG: heparinase II/III family protein, partial [Gaiellales bacterium]
MSARASGYGSRQRDLRPWIRGIALVVVALFLVVKVLNYVSPGATTVHGVESVYTAADERVQSLIRNTPALHSCRSDQTKLTVSGGFVCAAGTPDHTVYNKIFETYPAGPDGKNYVYTSTTTGTIAVANHLLAGVVEMPRYAPVRVGLTPTWREDPYHAVYWRLNYYALRPTQSLLAAYLESGDTRYAKRLIALDKSFFAHDERSSALAWQDDHAVAFRAMILTNQWWELREYHQLTESDSVLYLREIERTGQYLADPNHYQPEYNHGTNEAAALLDLALNFPTLPHAHEWLGLARVRLAQSMDDLVDGDGALIENSPYYHFYTLDKYWQILRFADRFDFQISSNFRSRLAEMIGYGSDILQPDSSVPLLGASL